MCLIIVKPPKINLPHQDILTNAWKNNHDGFGLAYQEGQTIKILKGAMRFGDTLKLIKSVPNPTETGMIMHFRYATEGTICPGNCHPYPISAKLKALKATKLTCQVALAHNGHIYTETLLADPAFSKTPTTLDPTQPAKETTTDTQQFIQEYLVDMGAALFNKSVLSIIGQFTQSKFAIIRPDRIHLIGNFLEDKGLYYSNASYKDANYWKPLVQHSTYFEDGDFEYSYPQTTQKAALRCDWCQNYSEQYSYFNGQIVCDECWKETTESYPQIVPQVNRPYSTP